MRGKIIIISILIALLLSSGNLAGKAYADAILFPWIVKSNTASTLISVVNTGGLPYEGQYSYNGIPLLLHYDYRYKASTANGDTELCHEYDFNRPTSANDIVSFDASGIMGDGKALFNDSGPYNDQGFLLSAGLPAPRRGFLIVDNNTALIDALGQNLDGTLYGEALIIDTEVGMTWGYTAYNARFTGEADQPYDPVYFNDRLDYQGEVIGATEAGRTVILPPSEFSTKFYVTPIGMNGQRYGDINTKVFLSYGDPESDGSFYGGMFLNDEQPISFTTKKNVVCTTALRLDELIPSAAYAAFTGTGGQGWAYIKTEEGNVEGNQNQSSQAVIGKLEWNIFAQSVAIDLSKTADCISCKDKCISDCSTIGKKPDYKCERTCGKKCQPLCIVKKSVESWPGNFTWIRSGESLPSPWFFDN